MAEFKQAPANAPAAVKLLNWVDNRFPLSKLYNEHMGEYYAPKNFNFWYIFGSLAMLVLVIQIVTGIFLTMHSTACGRFLRGSDCESNYWPQPLFIGVLMVGKTVRTRKPRIPH